ncbi:phosphoribosylglycinamide formyltransferase [Luminiphilus sp.]|nr:phosphoribosylglycinamide formyltransferase [Luminiphilus sp.]MDC1116465.1 phosphoribosylglycinamide formyltransferase [Luminiphilus sp.]
MTQRIVVLLSGRGSNFQSLLNASLTGELAGNIDLVISNRPQAGGLTIANSANIDTALIDHQAYATRDAFDADLAGVINRVSPDLIVLAGFMRILTQGFVSQFAGRLLNIHPSLLPLYPGLNTHQRALDNGDTHAGATVHYVTGELDGGPSVIQARVPIESGDTKEQLAARILQVEHRIYPQAVNWHLTGRLALQDGVLYKDSNPLPATGELWRGSQ